MSESVLNQAGKKFDQDKPRYDLMPLLAEMEVVEVLTYGAMKYDEHNWRNVSPLNQRYYSAARRHLQSFLGGESRDPESGLHHLAHASCCLLFMLQMDIESEHAESSKSENGGGFDD